MKLIRFWGPVAVWMTVIFIFSGRQKVAVTDSYALSFLFFKTLHIIEYAFLFVLAYRAVLNTVSFSLKKRIIVSFIIVVIYAITDEIHQRFVPTREGRLRDVIIDCIGGMIGWIFLLIEKQQAPKKLKRLLRNWQLE